ncbi:6630_t:CDS:1, partial [Gigaspora rosea]
DTENVEFTIFDSANSNQTDLTIDYGLQIKISTGFQLLIPGHLGWLQSMPNLSVFARCDCEKWRYVSDKGTLAKNNQHY